MNYNNKIEDYISEYNQILSQAAIEHKGKFSALASPTLNKQETVTFLYKSITANINISSKSNINKYYFTKKILFIIKITLLFFKLLIINLKFRIKSLPKDCLYFRTWLVPKTFENNIVRDDYFRDLIDDLSKDKSVVVAFQPLEYGKLISKFKKLNKLNNYIIPIGLLSLYDVLKLFIDYIFSAKLLLKNNYIFKNKNITSLINHSLEKDYYELRSFQAYLDLYIARKVNKYNPKYFIYIFENQAWENAYLQELKDSKIKIIGYQSSGFSYRFLNFFPTKIDKFFSLFPDKIITVGDTFTKLLTDLGNFPIPIQTFAALRFNYPQKNNKYLIEKPILKIHRRILYAFAVHSYQYTSIIEELINTFAETNIKVDLKLHPLYNDKKIDIKIPNNFSRIYSTDMNELKSKYDIVLFNDNSFGIESLLMGVKSYEYKFGEIYPENRLIDFKLYDYSIDNIALNKIRDKILDNSLSKDLNQDYISKYINNTYEVYNYSNSSVFN